MWQALRAELHPQGLEVVTVALDTGGVAAAGPWIERAAAEHPSLIDEAHITDELFGFVNVPNAVWINEDGMIVRPAEPATPHAQRPTPRDLPPETPPQVRAMMDEARKIRLDGAVYIAALRDWVANGAASRYALSPDEVIEASGPRGVDEATAAAHFELGQHLHRTGQSEAAVPHFREAHRLHPDNWTYKRQAWSFADPLQGPSDVYDSDWLSDIKKIGAENYYPPLKM